MRSKNVIYLLETKLSWFRNLVNHESVGLGECLGNISILDLFLDISGCPV